MQVPIKPVNAAPSSPGRQDVSLMTGIILLVTRPWPGKTGSATAIRQWSAKPKIWDIRDNSRKQTIPSSTSRKWTLFLLRVSNVSMVRFGFQSARYRFVARGGLLFVRNNHCNFFILYSMKRERIVNQKYITMFYRGSAGDWLAFELNFLE